MTSISAACYPSVGNLFAPGAAAASHPSGGIR